MIFTMSFIRLFNDRKCWNGKNKHDNELGFNNIVLVKSNVLSLSR